MIKALLKIAMGVPMSRARLLSVVVVTMLPTAAWPQGNPVGPEFRVNSYTTGFQWQPAIAADALGNFVVVWSGDSPDELGRGIFGQRYDSSGMRLGPAFHVNTFTPSNQAAPAVASDPSGNFVVVWSGDLQDGSDSGIFGRRYANSGAPLDPEFRVNTYTTELQSNPAIAVADTGTFVVAWHSQFQDGSYTGIYAQRYASTGTPVGPEFRVNTYTTLRQTNPRIGIDPAGNFVVVWEGPGDGASYGVFGQRFAASGVPIGAEFRINSFTSGPQTGPQVDGDASGNFVVVWMSQPQDGSGIGIFGQRFAASGVPLGGEFRVNTFTGFHQYFPALAGDGSGNFVVAWQSFQGGSNTEVFGQRYDAAGIPLGGEFRVNSTVAYDQERPAMAVDDAGEFLVVWSSWTLGSSGWNVFGQRYRPIVPVELMQFAIE